MIGDSRKSDWQTWVIPSVLVAIGLLLLLVVVLSIADAVSAARRDDVSDIASLIHALVWPTVLLFALSLFQKPIYAFLERLSKVTIKAGDAETTFEAEATRVKVSALLGAAESVSQPASSNVIVADLSGKSIAAEAVTTSAEEVARLVNQRTLQEFSRASMLWVDDRPQNNQYLIRAFQELGIRIDLAASTDQALGLFKKYTYDVIITDVSRPPDTRAGYTLLKALGELGNHAPVIVFAGSDSEEHRKEAIAAGAIESTNRPQRIFNLVTTIIYQDTVER